MSRILKAPEEETSAARFSFDDWGSASRLAAEARCEAERILNAAREEAEQIRTEAQQAGLAAAMSEFDQLVEQAAELKFEAWLPTLQSAVAEVEGHKSAWLAQWERSALKVAIAIASRILRVEIERQPEISLSLVRESLELSSGAGEAQLHLHPDDIALLGPRLNRLFDELGRTGKVTVVSSNAISRGGCRLETRLGTIDQQFEAQLARIEEELR